jgi:hypothetical protein
MYTLRSMLVRAANGHSAPPLHPGTSTGTDWRINLHRLLHINNVFVERFLYTLRRLIASTRDCARHLLVCCFCLHRCYRPRDKRRSFNRQWTSIIYTMHGGPHIWQTVGCDILQMSRRVIINLWQLYRRRIAVKIGSVINYVSMGLGKWWPTNENNIWEICIHDTTKKEVVFN